jgi:uncharacterized membrane protein (DUF106 family)
LVFGIQSLLQGNVAGFVEGMVSSLPVIGLFLVLFAITHFLFVKLFNAKHATILALVLSIYPFIDLRIYNYLISLNAFVVGFLVFIAMIIMIWGLSDHGVKELKREQDLIRKIKKDPKLANDKENIRELKRMLKEMR